jgi:F-type H+-transporting ATPase subunit delta
MAELATIARPYAEALFKASAGEDVRTLADQLETLAQVAGHAQLRQFADSPKVSAAQVFELVTGVARLALAPKVANLLQTVIDASSGVSDARIVSAFPLDAGQLADVVATLEKRFGRKLNATVTVDESLIGGIRVEVGDEVLDTSVKARLEQMKVALTH